MRCVASCRAVFILVCMKPDIAHVRLLPRDRQTLDELADKASETGLDLTDSDLIRLAIRKLDPNVLFQPPGAVR
jgi:hypothetical protein